MNAVLSRFLALALGCLLVAPAAFAQEPDAVPPKRFFADDSFWNQKIPADARTDPRSLYWISLLKQDQSCKNFGINARSYTIPVLRADADTPRVVVAERRPERFTHHASFKGKPIPIPPELEPSPGTDAHAVIVDEAAGVMWDMWHAERRPDGSWASNTGIAVDLSGPGVFDPAQFPVKNGESIHRYGPGRAAGVPVAAGLIMHHEAMAGRIEHKLAAAVRFVGFERYVYPPAIWTDGTVEGGLPEGATLQLDPNLDLAKFNLTPAERAVARAMQEYGMVIVDFAAANALYAEGLWYDKTRSWDGVLRDWQGGISSIPLDHYRVLDTGPLRVGGYERVPFHTDLVAAPRNCPADPKR